MKLLLPTIIYILLIKNSNSFGFKKKLWNMFRISKKDITVMSVTSSGVFIVNFKHISQILGDSTEEI